MPGASPLLPQRPPAPYNTSPLCISPCRTLPAILCGPPLSQQGCQGNRVAAPVPVAANGRISHSNNTKQLQRSSVVTTELSRSLSRSNTQLPTQTALQKQRETGKERGKKINKGKNTTRSQHLVRKNGRLAGHQALKAPAGPQGQQQKARSGPVQPGPAPHKKNSKESRPHVCSGRQIAPAQRRAHQRFN